MRSPPIMLAREVDKAEIVSQIISPSTLTNSTAWPAPIKVCHVSPHSLEFIKKLEILFFQGTIMVDVLHSVQHKLNFEDFYDQAFPFSDVLDILQIFSSGITENQDLQYDIIVLDDVVEVFDLDYLKILWSYCEIMAKQIVVFNSGAIRDSGPLIKPRAASQYVYYPDVMTRWGFQARGWPRTRKNNLSVYVKGVNVKKKTSHRLGEG